METIEERANGSGMLSQYISDYRYDKKSATEQKSIDDKKIKTLYETIAESKWFTDSYKGKSLGEFIEVEL